MSVFLLLYASNASGQASKFAAAVEGTVSDSSGALMPKTTVTLQNTSTNQTRTATTNDRGLFRAEALAVGTYEVRVEQTGFASYRLTGVVASLGQTVHLEITLVPASTSAEVTVSAQSSALEPTQTSVVSSVDRERIEELPVRSRNSLDFVLLAPGLSESPPNSAQAGATSLANSGFAFGGLRARSNYVSIDGLDNNDEFTGSSRTELSPEIVQEFQIVNNGLSAESGGASGGSINVITRSGTNTLHGDAFIFAQDSALNARDPIETEPTKPSFRRFRAGLALGGPIEKDRTFYYAAAEQERNRGQIGSDIDRTLASTINAFLAAGVFHGLATRRITTAFSPIARAETEAASKLDHQLTKSTALMLRYAFTGNQEPGNAFNMGGPMDTSTRGSSFITDHALSGSLTTVLQSEAVSDVRFQIATRRAVLRTNEPFGPEIDIAGLVTFGRPYAGNGARRENHYQLGYTYTRSAGKHLWKMGAVVKRVRLRAHLPDGFGGVYLFGSLSDFLAGHPDQFRQSFGTPTVDFPLTSFGGFVQDHWSFASRVTLDLGVRYDFERLPALFNQDTNNISPRIGVAWNPSSKWVLRAGYGVFFDRYVLANLARAIEKNGSQAFEEVVDGAGAAGLFALTEGSPQAAPTAGIAPSIFRPDPRMATPYSQQASAGVEYLLAKDVTLRADYLFVDGLKLPRTLNVNLLPPVVLTLANAASLGVSNPLPQQIGREVFSPRRRNTQFDDIYALQNSARSNYNGASLTLSRQMNEELEFSASYTLSKTFDDASDFDEQPQSPFKLAAEKALSLQHEQQRFVLNALWDLPIGEEPDSNGKSGKHSGWFTRSLSHIEVAPIFTAESYRLANPITGLDSNRSHAFPLSARPLDLGRNSLQTPGIIAMDLRVLKYFPFGESRRLDLVAEFFNLFNRANVAQINSVFGSDLTPIAGLDKPTEAAGARQVQFSLDFEF